MKISPQQGCAWSYNGNQLSIYLTADDGSSYLFGTHFNKADLMEKPADNSPFCIRDAQLLTVFQAGLSNIGLDDSSCLDLGLNGVACCRFVKPGIPLSRYFWVLSQHDELHQGQVVSIYARNGAVCDCLLLEENVDADGLLRLMLLNPELRAGTPWKLTLGAMIRVIPSCVCGFRAIREDRNNRYA